jgi:hypothetical protein
MKTTRVFKHLHLIAKGVLSPAVHICRLNQVVNILFIPFDAATSGMNGFAWQGKGSAIAACNTQALLWPIVFMSMAWDAGVFQAWPR